MVLDANQMKRQKEYETSFHWLGVLFSKGIITQEEYDSEYKEIESKYRPIIVHIPLLYKE